MITQSQLKDAVQYDEDEGLFYWVKPTGKRVQPGQLAGSVNNHGRYVLGINGCAYLQSRLVWLFVHGSMPVGDIDHIDGDPTNNRLKNLRDVPHQENMKNMPRRLDNKSGHSGICWDKSRGKWRVQIDIDGMKTTIGRFADKENAVNARKEAESTYGYHPNHGRNPLITKEQLQQVA